MMKEYMQRKIELINRELDGIYAENTALNTTAGEIHELQPDGGRQTPSSHSGDGGGRRCRGGRRKISASGNINRDDTHVFFNSWTICRLWTTMTTAAAN